MDELAECEQKLRDARDCLRIIVWAGRRLVRETALGAFPATRQSMELLGEALRDARIAGSIGR